MKKYYKIYYYQTMKKVGDELETFTYHHIHLETIILKVKSPWPGSILKGEVSVLRPDIGFLTRLPSFYYKLELKEYLEKINTSEEVGLNIKYLLKNVKYELGRID
jgi:hypothetical protein